MKLNFTKMQGTGNDFVIIDGVSSIINLSQRQIQQIANRYFGVGCDQVLIVEKANTANVDFRYRIFNADGGEVEQCGNGARCFMHFVIKKGLTNQQTITVETASGIITLTSQADGQVKVNMGTPSFSPEKIPFDADKQQQQYSLKLDDHTINITVVSMGNPHAITIVKDVENAPVANDGPQITSHARFAQRVNAGFMQIIDKHQIKLRVYERGSGETLACGTGACAAAVTGIEQGLLDSPVLVNTHGGQLTIEWQGGATPVMMTGSAKIVFEGEIEL